MLRLGVRKIMSLPSQNIQPTVLYLTRTKRCLNNCCRSAIGRQLARMKKRILKADGEVDIYVDAGECRRSYCASHCTLDVASSDRRALSGFRREASRRLHLRGTSR